jgi:hypothetical protein
MTLLSVVQVGEPIVVTHEQKNVVLVNVFLSVQVIAVDLRHVLATRISITKKLEFITLVKHVHPQQK